MVIDKRIDSDNWHEIKDILPQITEIKSLNLSYMELTEFPKMSHITINSNLWCLDNKIKSFKGCPTVNGDLWCFDSPISSFKGCPDIGGKLYCDILVYDVVQHYSRAYKISLLDAQIELYHNYHEGVLAHIDKFPDLVAYIRLKELSKLLCT